MLVCVTCQVELEEEAEAAETENADTAGKKQHQLQHTCNIPAAPHLLAPAQA